MNYVLVFVGGGLGSMLRLWLHNSLAPQSQKFPWATFMANLISALVFGAVIQLFLKGQLSDEKRLLLTTGFCGGLSTFSTFTYENYQLFSKGEWTMALLHILLSWIGCLVAMGLIIKVV